jgi:hypothetical protein
MHDNHQKKQMTQAWDNLPIGRAVKVIWAVLKHGVPAGADGRDITMDISLAEKLGIKDFGANLTRIAPANQYVLIPAMNGENAKYRFSKDFAAVTASSYPAHLARLAEANMADSHVPVDTALGIILKSAKENEALYPGAEPHVIAQKVVLAGSYHLLLNTLRKNVQYLADITANAVVPEDIRVLRCTSGNSPQVRVTTPAGGQKTYTLDMDEMSLKILHGEMSGIVTECPYAPSLDFPLASANYTAMFLHERGEVRLDVQWDNEPSRAEDWSEKLMFK